MTGPDMTRQISRLGGIFLLERARFVARTIDRNFVTALVFLAITRANVGDLTKSRDAAAPYLGLGEPPPDALRTPVTVYALARSLGIPYETVRRHVGKLKAAGKPYKYLELKDMGHTINTWSPDNARQVLTTVEGWLKTDCGPGGL